MKQLIEFVVESTKKSFCINLDKVTSIELCDQPEEIEATSGQAKIYKAGVKIYFSQGNYAFVDTTGQDEEFTANSARMIYDKIKLSVDHKINRITL